MSDNQHHHDHEGHAHCTTSSMTTKNTKPLKDPVCGMTVSATSTHQSVYQDKQFYLSCTGFGMALEPVQPD